MRRALVVALALTISTLPSPAQASNNWVMTAENVTLGINGVSPHVERFNGVDRVWRSDGPNGTTISDCNDAGVCTSVSGSKLGPDFTLITFPNGTKRAYFKDFEADSNRSTQLRVRIPDAHQSEQKLQHQVRCEFR